MSDTPTYLPLDEAGEITSQALRQMISISAPNIHRLTGRRAKIMIIAALQPMSADEHAMVLTASSMSADMMLDCIDGVRPELLERASGDEDSEHFVGPKRPSDFVEALAELVAMIERLDIETVIGPDK